MKVRLGIILASLSVLLLPAAVVAVAHAQSFQSSNNVSINQTQTINSSLYSAGNTVDIAGTVNGDVYCAGQNITISGTVNGDILCAGQTIDISGTVDGSIRVAGQTVNLSGKVKRNVSIAAQSYNASSSSAISGDATITASTITSNGSIGRDAVINGGNIIVNGVIGRNIYSNVKNLSLGNNAQVGGDLTYRSMNKAAVASGAKVSGKIKQTAVPQHHENRAWSFLPFALTAFLYALVSLLFSALVLVLIFGRRFQEFTEVAINKSVKTLLIGFLSTIALPVICVILLISIIGIPLGLLMLTLTALIFMLSAPFAAYYIGRLIVSKPTNSIEIMLVGTLVLIIVSFIPILGPLVDLLSIWVGVGIIIQNIYRRIPPAHYQVR